MAAVRVIRRLLQLLDVNADSITDGQVLVWDSDTEKFIAANNGEAPTDATYIVQTANANLSAEQALGDLATGILKNTTTTGVLSIATEGTDYYGPGATDVALADGGTGASLSDPGADRIMFWDDSASTTAFLQAGSGLSISGTVITASGSGTVLAAGDGLSLTGTVLAVNVDDSTLEISSDTLQVKDGGITAAKVAADVATQAELDAHINDSSAAHAASAISIADSGDDFTATDVEGALAELQSDHEADAQNLADHIADATDAHDASAVSVLDTAGNFTGTNVESVLAELQDNIDAGDGWTYVIKAATESVTSSTTLQDDDELFFQTQAGVLYELAMQLFYDSASASADLKFAIGEDTTVRGQLNGVVVSTADNAALVALAANLTNTAAVGTNPAERSVTLIGYHRGNGGTWKLQWAQNSSNGSATRVLADSFIKYRAVN